jgi:hypothetical protein
MKTQHKWDLALLTFTSENVPCQIHNVIPHCITCHCYAENTTDIHLCYQDHHPTIQCYIPVM